MRTTINNGIKGYIQTEYKNVNKGNSISFAQDTFVAFYQERDFVTGNKVKVLTPLLDRFDKHMGLFISNVINHSIKQLSWGDGSNVEMIKKIIIYLPVKNGKIDFDFMEGFIADLEAYLSIAGLKDYELTEKEEKIINNFNNARIILQPRKVKECFNVISYKKKFDANKVNIIDKGYPYVVRTAKNNGIRGYLNENSEYLNEGNTISFGQDTATIFYQKEPYFIGDKIKILKSKFDDFNRLNALFFVSVMTKAFHNLSWGADSFNEDVIKEQEIYVPIVDNRLDFEFMELFISAIQKLVIKDVVDYANSKIYATKQVIDKK